ncbi:MAG: hypothetical protein HYX27_01085 [Acidobacteria bacterium]|nr:hypothetical protein [Acidobacteriota bacterium]
MYRIFTVLIFAAVGGGLLMAQKSAYQSGDGQTSLYLDAGATIFNFAETKISVAYTNRLRAGTTAPLFYGYEAFAKASSGTLTLYSDKPKVPEGGASFIIGKYNPFKLSAGPLGEGKLAEDWLVADFGYSRAGFNIAETGQTTYATRYFDRYRFMGAYNALVNGAVLFGVAAGAERRNNLDDLQNATFQTALTPPSGPNSVVKTKTGFYGNYRDYTAAPIYTDLLFVLPPKVHLPGFDNQIGIDGFTRSDAAPARRSIDGGVGIFLTKKGAPTKVLGGISASWNDGKIRVAVVAGFNFK